MPRESTIIIHKHNHKPYLQEEGAQKAMEKTDVELELWKENSETLFENVLVKHKDAERASLNEGIMETRRRSRCWKNPSKARYENRLYRDNRRRRGGDSRTAQDGNRLYRDNRRRRRGDSRTRRQGDVDGGPRKSPKEDAYLREKWSTKEDAYLGEKKNGASRLKR